ncbi:MAG: tRNA glutamyl-Q(34) synthetase GluQRS [Actinomycetota bacterium]|nr:tRNA glutamyl-Q(34) synthetase GluQRS [Actinomycetota bacterium]
MIGRFAPSPTGRLHLGNLRTALAAWLFARAEGSAFLLRFEDLDQASVRSEHYESQSADLAALGIDWDGQAVRQSERGSLYEDALHELTDAGHTYRCYCSRREIQQAVSAPNGPPTVARYPGNCRELTAKDRAQREAAGRRWALRLRGPEDEIHYDDLLRGRGADIVDDVVLCRNDGVPAYNLAVVIDDTGQGIELVVRGDDLLSSVATQTHLAQLLGLTPPQFAHVPLVLGPEGRRLAKRDGAVTLPDRLSQGETALDVLGHLAATLGQCERGERVSPGELVRRFDPARLPSRPLVFDNAWCE